jgi:hypothetical protein
VAIKSDEHLPYVNDERVRIIYVRFCDLQHFTVLIESPSRSMTGWSRNT